MKPAFLIALSCLIYAGSAHAADVVITQKDKAFDKSEVAVKVGDKLVFRNADSTAHNVHSASSSHRFDLGLQKPGDTATLALDKDGTFLVRCAIHPKMKIEVSVK